MLKQFDNFSSWREDTVSIEGGTLKTLTFLDTKPNMFFIQNPNKSVLKIGLRKTPTADKYEYLVNPNVTVTIGQPTGVNYMYIYNDSSVKADITIFSIFDKFDINILKNLNLLVDKESKFKVETDGIVKGFAGGVMLPYGTHTIGSVLIDGYNENVSLPEGNNNIGSVDINTLPSLLWDDINNMKANIYTGSEASYQMRKLLSGETTSPNLLYEMSGILQEIADKNFTVDNVTVDNTEILTKLSTLETKLQNIYTYLSAVRDNTNRSEIRNAPKIKGTVVYGNNKAESLSYRATSSVTLRFGWLYNDGGIAHLKLNDVEILTIMAGEKFTGLDIPMANGDVLVLEADEPMFRYKYWTFNTI